MKKDQIKVGSLYLAKVTDKVVPVRLDSENARGGWDATNMVTNKKIRIKSAERLRGPVPERGGREHAVAEQNDPAASSDSATAAAERKKTTTKDASEKKPSGLNAAYQVLKDAGEPMRCKDMVDKMMAGGLWASDGKTPAATIYSAIIREISVKGAESRFKKTDRGLFTINA